VKKKHTTQADKIRALGPGRINREKVEATTQEEIRRQAEEDDSLWTEEMMQAARVVDFRKRDIHIRLDPDVLDFFQQQGRGYQSRINAVLRSWVEAQKRKAS
jgi:uncharacterized protein (DUF4415 family)